MKKMEVDGRRVDIVYERNNKRLVEWSDRIAKQLLLEFLTNRNLV